MNPIDMVMMMLLKMKFQIKLMTYNADNRYSLQTKVLKQSNLLRPSMYSKTVFHECILRQFVGRAR